MTLLALRQVVVARGGRTLAGPLDLSLDAGAAIVLTGPNGAGKTSLLRIAAGLLAPASGTVERAGAVAWAGETPALDGERTLARALHFWASTDTAPDAGARVAGALDALGLAALAEVPVRFLSTGQRRRAALARVVANRAPLWLLDEPANGLDANALGLLGAAIAAHRASGGAVLAATHQPLPLPDAGAVTLR